jgi:endonuclease/exonuclease/phosphatase family metal-dependent hydrolase
MAPALTVMTYNIHLGRDIAGVLDLDRIAAVIRSQNPDLAALQEVGRHWSAASEFRDETTELARRLDMEAVFAANVDREPPTSGAPRRQYGTAILSTRPPLDSRHVLLPRANPDSEQRGLLTLDVDVAGTRVRVHNVHLGVSADDRRLQVEALLAETDTPAGPPQALLGDLNARPNAPELGPLLERFGDAWDVAGEGDGFTFPAAAPTARIDYVLVSPPLRVSAAHVPALEGSDHLPLVAELALPG